MEGRVKMERRRDGAAFEQKHLCRCCVAINRALVGWGIRPDQRKCH